MSAADPVAALRERLIAMQQDLVETLLRDGYSAGLGATLAGIAAAIDALAGTAAAAADALFSATARAVNASIPVNSAASALPAIGDVRAVLGDDSREIRLTLYRGAEALGAAVLDPAHAIGLAGELIAAAHRRRLA